MGYFDVRVNHQQRSQGDNLVNILYTVEPGPRRRVEHVGFTGNHYFDSATLKGLLNVHAADTLDRHGAYSQALVSADVTALQAVYQNNGFSKVKVTAETSTPETLAVDQGPPRGGGVPQEHTAPLAVTYRIDEGQQLRVGSVTIEGNDHIKADALTPLLNSIPGQLLSPQNLAGDRNALLTVYLSKGFDQVAVDIRQRVEQADAGKIDVVFRITEGEQIFVRNVLLTGLQYTRPATVARAITLHPGDPLNQTALMETQRNLYEYALFNEVNTAIENPTGERAFEDNPSAGGGGQALDIHLRLRL